MAEDDPRRMELIRKFAAIYGRFDCKRKPEKPLTLHEVSVNEAAAQICRFMPALLTRRDELFPLARQVVRDSGYHYSKGHSKSYSSKSAHNGDQVLTKRSRNDYSPETEESIRKRQERLDQIAEELRSVNERTLGLKGNDGAQGQVEALQSRQQALLVEQTQLVNQGLQPNRYSRRRVDSSSPQSIGTSTIHTPLTSPFISPVGSKAHTSPTFAFSSSGRGSAFSRFVASSLPIAGGLKSGQISPNCPPHQSPTGNGPVSNADLTPSFNVTVSSAGQLSPNVGNLMAGNTSAFNAVATSSPTVAVFTPTTLSLNSGSTLFTSSNVSAFNPVVTSAPNNSVALNNATHQLTAGNGSAFNSLVTTTPKTSDPIFIETSFNSAPHQTMQFSPTSVTPLSVTANGTYTVQSTLSRSNSVVGPVNGDSSAAIYLE